MTVEPVLEHRQSAGSRWLRERRLRIALLIAFIESLLVIFSSLGWFWVVGAAVVAASQLISLIVPLLWEVVKFLAILVLVLLALFFLAILLLDRPGRR